MRRAGSTGGAARVSVWRVLLVIALSVLMLCLAGSLVLWVRHVQKIYGRGAVPAPELNTAYGDSLAAVTSSFTADLTYTSLDAPDDGEVSSQVSWDDAWFTADEHTYNRELAHTGAVLAALAYSESGYYQAGGSQPAYMEEALAELGFSEVSTASYRYRSEVVDEILNFVTDDTDAIAYTIARRHLVTSDGSKRDLILVSARGSYGSEWLSNLDLSESPSSDHGGYAEAAEEINGELAAWVADSKADGADVSVLLVGHSRGGAVANLTAAALDDARAEGASDGELASDGEGADGAADGDAGDAADEDAEESAGHGADNTEGGASDDTPSASSASSSDDSSSTSGEIARVLSNVDHVYAYTFASPFTTLTGEPHAERYANIFNVINPSDIMPFLPLNTWGYERYGVDVELPAAGEDGFDELYAQMQRSYRETAGVECAYDPADKQTVEEVLDVLSGSVTSVEELITPQGALAVLSAVTAHVDPIRILYSHYPTTYVAWLDVLESV